MFSTLRQFENIGYCSLKYSMSVLLLALPGRLMVLGAPHLIVAIVLAPILLLVCTDR